VSRSTRLMLSVLALSIGIGNLAYLATQSTAEDHGAVLRRDRRPDGTVTVELLSGAYRLDQIYKSMHGPRGNQPGVRLTEAGDSRLIWLTGVATDVVDADSLEPLSNEFFCHSNLTFNPQTTDPSKHNASMQPATHADWRIFTLVPGLMNVHLPEGFGVPIHGDTLVDYFTMALNQNPGQPDRRVRMKTRVTYRQVGPGEAAPAPLFRRAVYVYQQYKDADDASFAFAHGHQGENCGLSCAVKQVGQTPSTFAAAKGDALDKHPGATCCVENASTEGVVKQFGADNTVHWMVPPGKHVYRTEITQQMNLPFDTTVHHISGHLHPYGESIELIDLETKRCVFSVTATSFTDKLGVASMSESQSREGIPLVKDRRYELVARYHNTTAEPIDAMAILYFYARDQLDGR